MFVGGLEAGGVVFGVGVVTAFGDEAIGGGLVRLVRAGGFDVFFAGLDGG